MKIKEVIKRGVTFILKGTPVNHVVANIVSLAPNALLQDRVALITGGTSGIGYAIAKAFVNAGATVVISGRNIERVNQTVEKLRKECVVEKGRILGVEMDNTNVGCFPACLKTILSTTAKIDILVNNAGVLGGEISNVREEEYDTIMDTNLKGTVFLSKYVAKYMKEAKIKGNILNVASSSSFRPASSAYTISKWGIRGLTLGLAKSLIPHGIVVNGVAPGPTATPMLIKDDNDNLALDCNPLGRYALPEEIANMAVFLTSDMGRTIVGDIVCMTGGAGLITFDDVGYRF